MADCDAVENFAPPTWSILTLIASMYTACSIQLLDSVSVFLWFLFALRSGRSVLPADCIVRVQCTFGILLQRVVRTEDDTGAIVKVGDVVEPLGFFQEHNSPSALS